jgi:hypothetical protein
VVTMTVTAPVLPRVRRVQFPSVTMSPDPATYSVPFLAMEEELPEMASLARNGLVRRVVGRVHVAADIRDSPAVRATALRLLLPRRLLLVPAVLSGPTACWLAVGGPSPTGLDLIVPPRVGRTAPRGIRVHQMRLEADDVRPLGGLFLTEPDRTAVDIARGVPPDQALPSLRRLRSATGVGPDAVASRLDRMRGARGARQARRTIQLWREHQEERREEELP